MMSILDNVYNYYEKLVLEELAENSREPNPDQDLITDVVCLALNKLPTRYFRHGVDMAFYLSSADFVKMREEVKVAVDAAFQQISQSSRS